MLGYIDVLNDEQSKETIRLVDKLEKVGIRRAPNPMDFFTVGACTYLEGVENIAKYHKHRRVMNPVLMKHFTWLYNILVEKLSTVFGPVEVVDELAYPGFHVFGHKPFVNNSTDGGALKAEEVLSVLVHDLLERISGEVAK